MNAKRLPSVVALQVLLILAVAGYGFYRYNNLKKEKADLANTLSLTQSSLLSAQDQSADLSKKLAEAQITIEGFQGQISSITSTVGTLQKLSQTDKELLAKYSKVYFLNENYTPSSLSQISSAYTFNKIIPLEVLTQVNPFLTRLLDSASRAGLSLEVISAYRSFGTQSTLKSTYKTTYGAGTANSFSADQGYSEHQLGTAVDFTTPKVADTFAGFSKTPEYTWLQNNAYAYGFILSYPENNSFYVFEPWHWRFVGVALATQLHVAGKNFYDFDQRDIDLYLANIFD